MEPVLDTLKHLDIHSKTRHLDKSRTDIVLAVLGNPLVCDCEMRWYRKWYNDGWQEVDEDHIRDTDCTDPYDGMEHNIAKVSHLEIMFGVL